MTKIIVANWKANPKSQKEVEVLLSGISKELKNINNKIIICPPSPFFFIFKKNKSKKIILGAQDVSENIVGPYTGELPAEILNNFGVKYTIVGHSSRRAQGENDSVVNKKILNLLKFKITPIICIGEKNRDDKGEYLSFIQRQLVNCLKDINKSQIKNIIITYEPVWAISSNKVREATKEEFMEIKIFIKKIVSDLYNSKIAHNTMILYGGSVNQDNAPLFINDNGADGLLIGGNSLNAKKFIGILNSLK